MNKILFPILETAIKESLTGYESKRESNSLGALYINNEYEENLMTIYDDADNILNKVQLPDNQFSNFTQTLRQVLNQAVKDKLFEKDYIVKPFTVNLIDKDFIVIDELLFLDDDALKTNDFTWKSIERDLDSFIANLLK